MTEPAVVLSAATAEDVPEVAALLAQAFLDDPVVLGLVPGTHDRLARLTRMFTGIVSTAPLHTGAVDLARLQPGGEVVGVAVWESPRGTGGRVPLAANVRAVPLLLGAIGWRRLPHALRQMSVMASQRPKSPHWYLADIAVAPAGRGRGVGSALLRRGVARADGDARPAYLEATTPASRRLYERFGFQRSGTLAMAGDPTPMTRPARG